MVVLRIRKQDVVDAMGRHHVALTVFCPRHACTVPFDDCARCGFMNVEPRRAYLAGSRMSCAAERPRPSYRPDERSLFLGAGLLARDVPAGAAAAEHLFSVRPDVPLLVVAPLLASARRAAVVVVVDEHERPLGNIIATSVTPERWSMLAGEAMETHLVKLHEGAPLSHAIALLAFRRARQVLLVTDDGRVTSVLTELDALRWVAKTR